MKQHPKLSTRENRLARFKSKARLIIRTVLTATLFFCLISGLSACGGKASGGKTSEKTEEQISKDIQEQDETFNTYNLKVDSFSVSKRQTNSEDKTDYVWCEVTASNNNLSYSAKYELTYVLYNEGWLLEECNQESSSVTPISPPPQTQDEAMALVIARWEQADHNNNVTESHVALKSSLQKVSELNYAYYFRITWKNKYGYDGIPVDYAVYYQFDLASGQWNTEVANVDVNWG